MRDKHITQKILHTQLALSISLSIYFSYPFLPKSPRSLSLPLILPLIIPQGVLCNPEMLFPCIL